MNYLLAFSLLVLFSALCEAKREDNGNRIFGQNQEQLKTIFATIDPDGAEGRQYIPTGYSPRFRPPSKNSEPTLVHVSVKLFHVWSPRQGFLALYGIVETQHNDSRLEYEIPKGFNKKYINPMEETTAYNRLGIWQPHILPGQETNPESGSASSLLLFNSEGLVYSRHTMYIRFMKGKMGSDNATLTGSMIFLDRRYFKEDLMLELNPVKPFTLVKNSKIFPANRSYKVVPALGKCKSSVDHGPFGKREHSCLELQLNLVPVKL